MESFWIEYGEFLNRIWRVFEWRVFYTWNFFINFLIFTLFFPIFEKKRRVFESSVFESRVFESRVFDLNGEFLNREFLREFLNIYLKKKGEFLNMESFWIWSFWIYIWKKKESFWIECFWIESFWIESFWFEWRVFEWRE